jgi:hypothetical protein
MRIPSIIVLSAERRASAVAFYAIRCMRLFDQLFLQVFRCEIRVVRPRQGV